MRRETLMSRWAASTRAQWAVPSSRVIVMFFMTRFSCYTRFVSSGRRVDLATFSRTRTPGWDEVPMSEVAVLMARLRASNPRLTPARAETCCSRRLRPGADDHLHGAHAFGDTSWQRDGCEGGAGYDRRCGWCRPRARDAPCNRCGWGRWRWCQRATGVRDAVARQTCRVRHAGPAAAALAAPPRPRWYPPLPPPGRR